MLCCSRDSLSHLSRQNLLGLGHLVEPGVALGDSVELLLGVGVSLAEGLQDADLSLTAHVAAEGHDGEVLEVSEAKLLSGVDDGDAVLTGGQQDAAGEVLLPLVGDQQADISVQARGVELDVALALDTLLLDPVVDGNHGGATEVHSGGLVVTSGDLLANDGDLLGGALREADQGGVLTALHGDVALPVEALQGSLGVVLDDNGGRGEVEHGLGGLSDGRLGGGLHDGGVDGGGIHC
eukprot:143703_1